MWDEDSEEAAAIDSLRLKHAWARLKAAVSQHRLQTAAACKIQAAVIEWASRPGRPLARLAQQRFEAAQAQELQAGAESLHAAVHGCCKRPGACDLAEQASPKKLCT